MIAVEGLPINTSGRWTIPQLRAVLALCQESAREMGLEVVGVEITTHEDLTRWFFISARCLKHGISVSHGPGCSYCIGEERL